jgi:hypothetical protein
MAPRLLRSGRAGQPEPGTRNGAPGPVAALSHSRPSAEGHLACGVVLEAAGGARPDGCGDDGSVAADPEDRPVLPAQTEDETSIGWGEDPEPDDDERLRQDRPPHWDQ